MASKLLKSADLAYLLMLAHACSCSLMYAHLLFSITIEGLMMLDKLVGDQNREFWR